MAEENVRYNLPPETMEFYRRWCAESRALVRRTEQYDLDRDRSYAVHIRAEHILTQMMNIGREEYTVTGQTRLSILRLTLYNNLAELYR